MKKDLIDITRRSFMMALGTYTLTSICPAHGYTQKACHGDREAIFHGIFYRSKISKASMWDTWLYYHSGLFYLYYLVGPIGGWDGIELATSSDGIYWKEYGKAITLSDGMLAMGSGSVWEIKSPENNKKKFIMNYCETRGDWPETWTTIVFAESSDLINWVKLDAKYDFPPDEQWYLAKGRWDNIWTVPKPGGGFYGYWAATLKEKRAGLGFGETLDGVRWTALPPPVIQGLVEPPEIEALIHKSPEVGAMLYRSPEIGAIHKWNEKYYAILGLQDLEPLLDSNSQLRPGETVFVSDAPYGPFSPALKNRRLLVGNASYFCRFFPTPNEVLVNYHSWEIDLKEPLNVHPNSVYMAPLKRAIWDEEGTLRLMWWEGYEQVKCNPIQIKLAEYIEEKNQQPMRLPSDAKKTLIIEGKICFTSSLSPSNIGLYFLGPNDTKIVFLIRRSGIVEYGTMGGNLEFSREGSVNRDLVQQDNLSFRLVKKGRITEFYLNNFLMNCYCLPKAGSEQIGLLGPLNTFSELTAWYI